MSDRFVTVASFPFTPEAEMAKNLLESEGIPAFVAGGLAADVLSGLGGEALVQVREQDAPRAVSLLAAASAQVSLEKDWETQAECGVWVCPLCGTAVRLSDNLCPACRTPNPGIKTERSDAWADRDRRSSRTDQVKKSDQIQEEAPRSRLPDAEESAAASDRPGATGCVVLLFALPSLWLLWRLV